MEKEKIHDWFELTHAEYLAIPRSILQSMPDKWQEKFVELLNELDETFDWRRSGCWVKFKNKKGCYMPDLLGDYQRGRRILTKQEVKEIKEKHEKLFNLPPL